MNSKTKSSKHYDFKNFSLKLYVNAFLKIIEDNFETLHFSKEFKRQNVANLFEHLNSAKVARKILNRFVSQQKN